MFRLVFALAFHIRLTPPLFNATDGFRVFPLSGVDAKTAVRVFLSGLPDKKFFSF